MRTFSEMLSILCLLAFLTFHARVDGQNRKVAAIEELISNLHKKNLFNGAVVIGEEGAIIFSRGVGFSNIRDSILFTPLTPADGGSNAKTFTAASILWLSEEKKIKLSDPLQRYLPNYPYPNTIVWNVITHSLGGLPDYDYFFEHSPDTAIISNPNNLELIARNKPTLFYPPNTNFYYDNVGFDLGVLLVEQVSGKRYGQFLQEKIFGPLKMDSSFIRPARFQDWNPKRAIGYRYQKDSIELFDIADREGFYGGGNLWFSATDLYHWGESFYHNPILSKSLIKRITSPVSIAGKPSHLSLGAWYSGKSKDAFYYWGNVAGFYSWVYWDRKIHFTIAFMTNTAMPQWVRPLLTSALINIMQGESYTIINEPITAHLDRNNLEQVAGEYNIMGLGHAQITVRGSLVNLRVNNGMEYRMHLVDEKTFYVPGFDPWISFSQLKDNKFQTLHWSSTVLQATGSRISK